MTAGSVPARARSILPASDRGRALLLGLVMLAVGLLFLWPPLALIVPGALFVAVAFFGKWPEGEA